MDQTDVRFPKLAPDLTLEPRFCLLLKPAGQRIEISRYVSVHRPVDELCVGSKVVWIKYGSAQSAFRQTVAPCELVWIAMVSGQRRDDADAPSLVQSVSEFKMTKRAHQASATRSTEFMYGADQIPAPLRSLPLKH